MPAEHRPGGGAASQGPFGIIILAGGAGRRLGGQDKPSLVVGDRTLLASVVLAGTEAGAAQVIVVGPARRGLDGVCFVSEEPPGAGPVPALRRGLAAATCPGRRCSRPTCRSCGRLTCACCWPPRPGGRGAVLADDTGTAAVAGRLLGAPRRCARPRPAIDGTTLRGLLGPLGPVLVGPASGGGRAARLAGL